MKSHALTLAGNPELQDRLEIFNHGNRISIALADGAGGISGAVEAAEAWIKLVSENLASLNSPADCHSLLLRADQEIANDPVAGETTALVLAIDHEQIFGASAGDSEVYLFNESRAHNLTRGQHRKPFMGSGAADPVPLRFASPRGVLIAATDGLWKYTSLDRIQAELKNPEPEMLPDRLANLVRLRSGSLQDDIAIATVFIDHWKSSTNNNVFATILPLIRTASPNRRE